MRSDRTPVRWLVRVCLALLAASVVAQTPPPSSIEYRAPWHRSDERFIRHWLVLSEIPDSSPDAFEKDWLEPQGGEPAIHPTEGLALKLPNGGPTLKWRAVNSWGDSIDLSNGPGLKRDVLGYAFAVVKRATAGKARLCLGSDESVRVWVNGIVVLDHRTSRPFAFDEDQVEVDLRAGDNTLLVKLEQHTGPWLFAVRLLASSAIPSRMQEIAPSFVLEGRSILAIRTDRDAANKAEPKVAVQAVAPGGKVLAEGGAPRGGTVRFDSAVWPDGPYEIRCETRQLDGSLTAIHLPWYKGDAIAAARALVAASATADPQSPSGATVKMLADLVLDRLGGNLDQVTGNPWWAIHSPLMEYAELKLELAGDSTARARPYGFDRLAWRDETDGSVQFARAYLPPRYDPKRPWPLVIRIHGFNPPNPPYVRWWSVDLRHDMADTEYDRQGVIYLEPHGRGNSFYLGLGDADVVHAIHEAQSRFNVDPDRIYLEGDSMGGWGTWNVGTRHPDLFAALAPIHGGLDYHSIVTPEQLSAAGPLDRFLLEKQSSWAMADSLLNLPVFVHHGDADPVVPVSFSRYGVRLLQRWGYDVRYEELPGYGHEDLGILPGNIRWFLHHRCVAHPTHVRLRSAELRHASAYWVTVDEALRPNRFMVVDAEIVGRNTLRLDTENVGAITLSPVDPLIDSAKPVDVVWNGEPHEATLFEGKLTLRAQGCDAFAGAKNAEVAGPIGDVFDTPFAIVTGTVSPDPAMAATCIQQSDATVSWWKDWQKQTPRVFRDTEISDDDIARYSLILIGGPNANLVAGKFASRLPLDVAADRVTVAGRAFPAHDARIQFIYPNPANPHRYVLVVAGTSPEGLKSWVPSHTLNADFDFKIETGAPPKSTSPLLPPIGDSAGTIARGWFDRRWQRDDSLIYPAK